METVEVPSGTILVTWDSNLKGQGGGGVPDRTYYFMLFLYRASRAYKIKKY